jgi:hypothetical protein
MKSAKIKIEEMLAHILARTLDDTEQTFLPIFFHTRGRADSNLPPDHNRPNATAVRDVA